MQEIPRMNGGYSMQLRQLEYIIKIAECGSITQAAEQLFISQPSLTKSILHLETEYNIKIFLRKSRGIELTNEGRDFIRYAKGVLTAANSLDQRFSLQKAKRESRLFVGTQQLDFVYDAFLKIYENNKDQSIHYNLVETDRNCVIEQVLNGQIDLGIIVRSSADEKTFLWHTTVKKLDIHTLAQAGVYACVGPKSPVYNRQSVTISEINNFTSLVLDINPNSQQNWYFGTMQNHFNKNKLIYFNTVSACEHFLIKTDALLFIAKWAIGCFKSSLIRFFPVLPGKKTDIMPVNELLIIKRAGEPMNPTEQEFIQELEQFFAINE